MAKPWDKRSDETPKAFAAFAVYRDMGTSRSLERVRQDVGKSPGSIRQLERYSSAHAWVARAEAYDAHIDALAQRKQQAEVLKMRTRHAQLATAFQNKVVERLQTLNSAELTPTQLAQWLEASVKIERLSRGETSASLGLRLDRPVSSLSDEELDALIEQLSG